MNFHQVVQPPLLIIIWWLQNVECSNSIAPLIFISWLFPAFILALLQYVLRKAAGMTFKTHKCDHILQWLPTAPHILPESLTWVLGPCTRPLPSSPGWAQATPLLPSTHWPLTELQSMLLSTKRPPHLPLCLEPSPSTPCTYCLSNTHGSFTCHILKESLHVTPRL